MERNKALIIAALTVTAGAAAFAVAGTAFGQDWYEYKGRLTAGNAYLVTVPAGAEALELELIANGEDAAATVAVFGVDDEKLDVWKLDGATRLGTLVNPAKGDHVLFVYSLTNAGLSLRTLSDEPSEDALAIKRIGTERHDLRIASVEKPAALSQKFTAPKLDREPVFATLLYSGSVENLAATVSSPKGVVLEVVSETGTAYSPGLYGSVTGERNVFPENLGTGAYTATATADRFEGDLFLTFATYTRGDVQEIAPPATPDVVAPKERLDATEIHPGIPTAVTVHAGVSEIVFRLAVDEEEDAEDGHYDGTWAPPAPTSPRGWGWDAHYGCPEGISVYTPDDRLLGVAVFDEETLEARLPVEAPGEYVVMVRGGYEPILASLDGVIAPETRELMLKSEEIDLGKITPFSGAVATEFTLEKAPLGLAWRMTGSGGALMAEGVFTSSLGEAVRQSAFAAGGWSHWSDSGMVVWENLVEGDYTFTLDSNLAYGKITGYVLSYDREGEVEEK